MSFRTFAVALLVVVLCAHSAIAGSVNFDDFTPPDGFGFANADRYRGEGIVFDRPIPIEDIAARELDNLASFIAAGGSVPNVLALTTSLPGAGLSIEAIFVVPGTAILATTDFVEARFFDTEVGSSLGTLEAFDIEGALLGISTLTTPPIMGGSLQISAPGIHRIRFSIDADGGGVDNLVFNTPTALSAAPEPTTGVFALLGILPVISLLRRRTERS